MDDLTQTLALTLGASWASGINLYAAVLVLGFLGATGTLDLPAGLEILSDPLVMLAAGVMFLAQFVADKVPGVDSTWDGLHTFIRIPAGALMAVGSVGDLGLAGDLGVGLLGGAVAAASHAAKTGTRLLINTSPEPFTNWTASVTEDIGVVGGLVLAVKYPLVFLALLALFFLLLIWLLPKLWRGIKRVFGAMGRLFRAKTSDSMDPKVRSPGEAGPGGGPDPIGPGDPP